VAHPPGVGYSPGINLPSPAETKRPMLNFILMFASLLPVAFLAVAIWLILFKL
jgi:hypothetical protein